MDEQKKFVIRELWLLAWAASVQRAKLYKAKDDSYAFSKEINQFRDNVIGFITQNIIPGYCNGCSEEQHYKNIDELIAYANRVNPGILSKSGYKYGVAQKLLNLALKYYWCMGLIKEPPHCPIDRIVINKTKYRNKINWTQITERSQYQRVIEDIKVIADKERLSVAMWELIIFGRR